MSMFAGVCSDVNDIQQPCKLVRTNTKPAPFQIGQTCVPTSVGNVIMHNICTVLKHTTPECLLLDQFVFDMILERYPNCIRNGVSTEDAINYVLGNLNTSLNSNILPNINMDGLNLENMKHLIKNMQQNLDSVVLTTFRFDLGEESKQRSIATLQEMCKQDLYGVIKIRGYEYNQKFKELISAELQDFFPAPSFGVFGENNPITVFQNPNSYQKIIDIFMSDYLLQDAVVNTFGNIKQQKRPTAGPTTWGHAMVLKAVFTYQGAGYALIKNSFGPEYGLYDEQVKGLNGHIILPMDMFPEYMIFVPEPILGNVCGKKRKCIKGGKKTRKRPRKTMRARRPNKKTRVNRKKTHRK